MSTTETLLLAVAIIFTALYLIWRLGREEHFAPLVEVQILAGTEYRSEQNLQQWNQGHQRQRQRRNPFVELPEPLQTARREVGKVHLLFTSR